MNDYHYPRGWQPSSERKRRQRWDSISMLILAALLLGLGFCYAKQFHEAEARVSKGILHHARQIEKDL